MLTFLETSGFLSFMGDNLRQFWAFTGFANATWGHIAMIGFGLLFI